ncbi:ankyrin repeats (3 copies) domain-containing protein [Hirsutella rhossiliensis]|uniref:Ankyrin repeats (3 copies) domain-containing protein n=1 Tax=Hirsutella rhossiliensis TaxID=111463 RepID=A0A9P8N8U1_9HYPO|nr:ankyrin repeats (3 copies) domain-containing protein [Hirsutella rhossiliensis]KAH0968111.1 ankyrin repeats (3 copies) domain-containing protein [Hirsutella rhossiliensis]
MLDRFEDIGCAAEGTCLWLLQHKSYRRWTDCDRGLLWIKGKPGSGKSTLLRYAYDKMKSNIRKEDLILNFFFHGRGADLQKTPLGLIRSLLHQVLEQVPGALQDLVAKHKQRCDSVGKEGDKWHWHANELQRFFRSSLPTVLKSHHVWLFVDALDECGEEGAVDLVQEFESLLQGLPTGLQFHICFTCRHYPILALNCELKICVEDRNKSDISTYVEARLAKFDAPTRSAISNLVTTRASGIFMWAHLVVKRVLKLEREGEGFKRIEEAVYAIPQGLDELYRNLVGSMNDRLASLKLIQWICFATRPLSLDELRWAMAADADCPHKSLHQCQSAADYAKDSGMMERKVKTLSCGLAEVVESSNAQVVQFIHQSVKDFFVDKGLSALDGNLRTIETETGVAHYRMSRTCIRYLAMEEVAQSIASNHHLEAEFPLLRYATMSWIAHAKHSEAKVSQENLLDDFHWPLEDVVRTWNVHRRTPLLYAAERGHETVVQELLLKKADVNVQDIIGATALHWAAPRGHKTIWGYAISLGN